MSRAARWLRWRWHLLRMMSTARRRPSWRWRLTATVPSAFLSIVDALVAIVTLGTYDPRLSLRFLIWMTLRAGRRTPVSVPYTGNEKP